MTEAERLYRKGSELMETDPDAALTAFCESLRLAPNSPTALWNRAVTYARIGRSEEAAADSKTLQRVAPELGKKLLKEFALSADPYVDIAMGHFRKENYAAAIKACRSALAFFPEHGDALVVLGLAQTKQGSPADAEASYADAIRCEPENYFAFINRAELRASANRDSEALSDFTRAIELRSEETAPYQGRAMVYGRLGLSAQAAEDVAKAAELQFRKQRSELNDR